jgi:D-arabinose 1-dehydrogenase-like Zn-dependent alcohol dehydrogenase
VLQRCNHRRRLYIDSREKNAVEELQKLGGARVIIATAPDPKAMAELIGGLGPNGKLLLIGVGPGTIELLQRSLSGAPKLLKDGQG